MFNDIREQEDSLIEARARTKKRSAEIFNRDLASIFNRSEQKKIAPPPPALTDFEQRINKLRNKGKRRGKRYSIIGISSSILIVVVVAYLSFLISKELTGINAKIDEREKMFEDVLKERETDCSSSCCQDSLYIINQNHFRKANYEGHCPDGYNIRSLSCMGSLSWCVPGE